MSQVLRSLGITVFSVAGIAFTLAAVSAVSNLGFPKQSSSIETLSQADKVRLAETTHLRQAVGNAVWPGWADADIPAIVYNESYAFLVGYPDPPDGWIKVPSGTQYGRSWEVVVRDNFYTQPYVRQPLQNSVTPEAFAVQVGDRWVSSLQTFDWTRINLAQTIRQDLPDFLRPIFPYRLFAGQLIRGDDQYISLTAHEAFHAYQGIAAPDKLAAAETINRQVESQYPWTDAKLQVAWQTELDILAEALQSTDPATTRTLVSRFLDTRLARREAAGLSPAFIAYEQQREWVEGLARYAELEIWRQANLIGYTPLPETIELPDFDDYAGFETRWSRELQQMTRMADHQGDGRFYYSGMAQAYLLDRLMPGWKSDAFDKNIWLDDLLAEVR